MRAPITTPRGRGTAINPDNRRYMTAKAARAGHQLGHVIAALADTPEADSKAARLVP